MAKKHDPHKTDPVLIRAYKIAVIYAKAAGALIQVFDQNYQSIPEMADDDNAVKIPCLFCKKRQVCQEMHLKAMQEACTYGGSRIYACDIGFMFWTSPIYSQGRFAGALLGTGFLGVERKEAAAQLCQIEGEAISEEEALDFLKDYPQGGPERIKALADLMLICAESVSTGNESYHGILKRRAAQQADIAGRIQELKAQYPQGNPVPGYPLDKEKALLAALRCGDTETGQKALDDLLAVLLFSYPDNFKFIQLRAVELVVLLSRAAAGPGNSEDALLKSNDLYISRIQETANMEELTDILHIMTARMASLIFSFQGTRHASALRKAERFIRENYERKISLKKIARAAGLSAPYFSTVFKEEMGENLSSYLNRLRVDKACHLLLETSKPLTEISNSCGFEDQSWFSKVFKHFTGLSPGKFRNQGAGIIPEISEHNISKNCRISGRKIQEGEEDGDKNEIPDDHE